MKLVIGLALLSAAILLIAYIGKLKRMPDAPKWSNSMFVLNPVIFLTVTGIAFGCALTIDGGVNFRSAGFGLIEAASLGAIAVLTVLASIGIRRMGKSPTRRKKWGGGTMQPPGGAVPTS